MKKRIVQILILGALVLTMVQPALADNCVSYARDVNCQWDYGCWFNPLTPNGQYWTQDICIHADGTSHVTNSYESGGCCNP
ncbi:MAG: hypothetical protein ACM3XM_00635 [Mycobacterium leprae]